MNMIQHLRKKHGMKQTELCRELNIVQGTLSGWENGKFEPDISALIKMSKIFHVSIDYILTGQHVAYAEKPKGLPLFILRHGHDAEKSSRTVEYDGGNSDGEFLAVALAENESDAVRPSEIYIIKRTSSLADGSAVIISTDGQYRKGSVYTVEGKLLFIPDSAHKPEAVSSGSVIGEIVEMRKKYN